jgi:hypothetical protein
MRTRWGAGDLLNRAIAAGDIREDISPEDLIRALVGMYMNDQPGWQKSVLRLVDVFIDGLRNRGAVQGTKKRKSPLARLVWPLVATPIVIARE